MPMKSILMVGESYQNSNLYYKTNYLSSTPFVYLFHKDVASLIVPSTNWETAKRESNVSTIYPFSAFNYVKKIKSVGHKDLAFVLMLKDVLDNFKVSELTVPKDFPVFYANGLTKLGIQIHIDCNLYVKERSIKSANEIASIKETQKALEKGVAEAERIIRESDVKNGFLVFEGELLTTEILKRAIEISLLKENCHIFSTIVACGKNSADPHFEGDTPITSNQPILIDVFPYHRKNRYFADMSRTFIKGQGHPKIHKMYDAVLETQLAVIEKIRSGVPANYLYQVACDLFNKNGYLTLREQKPSEPMLCNGFVHSIGHGIGLDVHETPFLFSQNVELKEGNVITIEPGLYNPELGGIRIEDIVVVKEKGCEILTHYHKNFVID